MRWFALPHSTAAYAIAVVRRSVAAERFVRGLLAGAGRRALLRAAGFGAP